MGHGQLREERTVHTSLKSYGSRRGVHFFLSKHLGMRFSGQQGKGGGLCTASKLRRHKKNVNWKYMYQTHADKTSPTCSSNGKQSPVIKLM